MALSDAGITAVIEAARDEGEGAVRTPWALAMRRMLRRLAEVEFQPGPASALRKLCEAGAQYGWEEWEATTRSEIKSMLSKRAKQSLRKELCRSLDRVTGPCLDLERNSFELALKALGMDSRTSNPGSVDSLFLKDRPSDRLFSIFRKFPVLARLWTLLIAQWYTHVSEVLERLADDRVALSRSFFDAEPLGRIVNLRCGLSDSHNDGRTVTLVQFEQGSVIYKPRSGQGEWEWHSLLRWMNDHSFTPKLKAGRVLRRSGYCWMEHISTASCRGPTGTRRFYERLGGIIAAAYLFRAVDCHRENLVVAGEYPVLVDVDTLWHVSPVTKTQDALSQLYRTGFFPNSHPRSLQSRSSALAYLARMARGDQRFNPSRYHREIIRGFDNAWRCLLGTRKRHSATARRLRRIRSHQRRWIYLATERYAAIRRASVQPAVLRLSGDRNLRIAELCARDSIDPAVISTEISSLKRLDIPYFSRRTSEPMPRDQNTDRTAVIHALKRALLRK
jgi:lantibiotic modifying enzyme